MTFDQTGLSQEVLKAVEEMGFTHPTPIQEQTIPLILQSENDVLALAQTGTGKTAAFGLPIIDKIDPNIKSIQSIILCPTRELCRQISRDLEDFSKFSKRCSIVSVYGGANIQGQISEIKRGAQIIVGTPGRVVDLINRRVLILEGIRFVVLDEADEMLNMGFKDDLDFILGATPKERQTLLFSATMPKEVRQISKAYMQNTQEVSVQKDNQSAENISHTYHLVNASARFETLRRIVDFNPDIYGIVFCRTRRETQQVSDQLIGCGYNADALHGELSQAQRDSVMQRFRSKHLQILVATDVAARGIDVDDVTHVIHYNLPDDIEAYIHRSGRTARAGKSGESIALISGRERSKIKILERKTGKSFTHAPIPQGKDICIKQLFKLADGLENAKIDDEDFEEFLPALFEKLESYSKEDLIKRFFANEFSRFYSYYKNARDLNVDQRDRGDARSSRGERGDRDFERGGRDRDRGRGRDRDSRDSRDGRVREGSSARRSDGFEKRERSSASRTGSFTRFFLNLGKKDELNPNKLMGFINEQNGLNGVAIGRIEVLKSFTFFEVDSQYSSNVIGELKDKDFHGRNIHVELAESDVNASHHSAPRVKKEKKRSFGGGNSGGGERKRKRTYA